MIIITTWRGISADILGDAKNSESGLIHVNISQFVSIKFNPENVYRNIILTLRVHIIGIDLV